MTDRRGGSGPSLLALDAPTEAFRALSPRTKGVPRPTSEPSFLQSLNTSARAVAADDERQALLETQAADRGYATLVEGLRQRGFRGDYEMRPLPGAAPFYRVGNIWSDIARARATDPAAFAGVDADPDTYRRKLIAPIAEKDRARRETIENSGWVGWGMGQLIGGFSDPINQASTVVGVGGARTIAQAALREAGLNLRIEAAQTPARIVERAARSEATTAVQVATDLGVAAGAGALFGGGMKALERPIGAAIERAATPAGKLAAAMRERIGWARMTDEERAATRALEREDEVATTSPFTPGAGADAHAARINRAVAAIAEAPGSRLDQLVPLSPPPRVRPVSAGENAARIAADPGEQFKNSVRAFESAGDDAARNPRSSATGRYQVIDSTWLRVARTIPEAKHMSDAGVLSMRTHPVWQELVMDRLVADYRRTLSRIGAPETPGNLYLAHFAGTGGASKILRADGDTAIEQLLTADAIHANPFLRGKTADQVIEWAHRAMNGRRGDAPVVRRDVFPDNDAGDVEWRAAQREVEAADAEWTAWQRDEGPPRAADDALDDAGDDIPFDLDDPRIRDFPAGAVDGFPGDDAPNAWRDAVARLRQAQDGEIKGMLSHPALDAPIDVKWGKAGDAANGFKGGYGLAHILAKHPEMEAELDRLPELIANMEVMRRDPRRERLELESPTHEAAIALTWHDSDQRWLVTAYEKNTPDSPLSARRTVEGGNGSTRPGAAANIIAPDDLGNEATSLREYWQRNAAIGEPVTPVWAVRDMDSGAIAWWSSSKRAADRAAIEMPGSLEVAKVEPDAAALGPPRAVEGFDGPDDVAAARQIDSLEHDLRMFMAEDEAAGLTVRLSDDGDVVSAADAMADLDADDAAIAAARACMVPGGGEE